MLPNKSDFLYELFESQKRKQYKQMYKQSFTKTCLVQKVDG